MVRKVLAQRTFSAILVAGGPPCQGNSSLNRNRKGVDDPRTRGAIHLQRIAEELEQVAGRIPVLRLLENVASAPKDSCHLYEQLVRGPPLEINARLWGWVHRRRHFYMSGPSDNMDTIQPVLPDGFEIGKDANGSYSMQGPGAKPCP